MNKISILIADDHKLIRETWSYILNSDPRFKVIASCGNGEEAIELAKEKNPGVILMDINMTPYSGLEATKQIRKILPDSKIIGVTMHSQPAYAKKMLQIGARGYVTKNSSKEEMIKAILEVYQGNKYLCEEIRNILTDQSLSDTDNNNNDINTLTEREMQIINLIKQGMSSKEISMNLEISLKTVEVHRHNILKKLKLKNSASLVNFINNSPAYI
ncbi:MAG TPA: response regulator transcription factor [Puia sp.]|nr:response regulator transcription factor [Puia sp.]